MYLIGAGPGAPDLISLRGYRCLRKANVVIYDHMVNPELLDWAAEGAERIDVGSPSPQESDQEAICYLLAEKAREGKTVARLKWGDPFLFDQGGEEALFLHEQKIRFEVVPGIPAAIGVSAHAGIPVTYPGSGDTVTIVRGHEDEGREKARVNWTALASLEGTILCYAGPKQLPKMIDSLLSHGRPADESAAIVVDGTLASQQTTTATLGELKQQLRDAPVAGPALLIVGKVVGFRDHVRWFDSRPLFGRQVLVMRAHESTDDFVEVLESHGAAVIVENDTALDIYRLLLDRKIDVAAFMSAAAILEFAAKYGADQAADLLAHTKVATTGAAADDAAARANITAAIHLANGTPAALADAIAAHFRS